MSQQKYTTKLRGPSRGAALVEYGILTGLIAVVSIGAVIDLGDKIRKTFDAASSSVSDVMAVSHSDENTEVDAPVEPTYGPDDMVWEISSVSSPGVSGYWASNGSATTIKPGLAAIKGLYSVDGSSYLTFHEDVSNDLGGFTLTCDHGSWTLPSSIYYRNTQNDTNVVWIGEDRPIFEGDMTYTCAYTR